MNGLLTVEVINVIYAITLPEGMNRLTMLLNIQIVKILAMREITIEELYEVITKNKLWSTYHNGFNKLEYKIMKK